MKSIYQRCQEAGIKTASHASDLYLPISDEAGEIITAYEKEAGVEVWKSTFKDAQTGAMTYDIYGAFDPFWKGKKLKKERRTT